MAREAEEEGGGWRGQILRRVRRPDGYARFCGFAAECFVFFAVGARSRQVSSAIRTPADGVHRLVDAIVGSAGFIYYWPKWSPHRTTSKLELPTSWMDTTAAFRDTPRS